MQEKKSKKKNNLGIEVLNFAIHDIRECRLKLSTIIRVFRIKGKSKKLMEKSCELLREAEDKLYEAIIKEGGEFDCERG